MGIYGEIADGLPIDAVEAALHHARAAASLLEQAGLQSGAGQDCIERLYSAAACGVWAVANLSTARHELTIYDDEITGSSSPQRADGELTAASPAIDTNTKSARPTGDSYLYRGNVLRREDCLDEDRRWHNGEAVQSGGTAIGELYASPADLATLKTMSTPYMEVPGRLLTGEYEQTRLSTQGITKEQFEIIRRIARGFLASTAQDSQRGGLGEPDMTEFVLFVGQYNPGAEGEGGNGLAWHADDYNEPVVRYVATLGETGTTQFGAGPVTKEHVHFHDRGHKSDPQTTPAELLLEQHPPGTISRFMADYGVHKTPDKAGFRLFMTISTFLRPRPY